MYQLILILTSVATTLLFLFNAPMLDLVGWAYTSGVGSAATKIHPSFYIAFGTATLALAGRMEPVAQTLRQPRFIIYMVAVALVVSKAAAITLGGRNEGELSAAIDTFATPLLLLVCLSVIRPEHLERMGIVLRIYIIANSLLAIFERMAGARLIPSFLDQFTSQDRASALLGHPLNAALLTGMLLVYLITSLQNRLKGPARIAEIAVHIIAMFAYGGRSALVFTAVVVIMSTLSIKQDTEGRRAGAGQRLLPIIIMLLGILLVFLPIPFIDATLDRFTNDKGSAVTRDAAVQLLTMIDPDQLLNGIEASQRQILMAFLNTPAGIEISWIALTVTYGLLVTLPMLVALPILLFGTAQGRDRSAFYMAMLFMIVTLGSLSIGGKSLLLSQTLILLLSLTEVARQQRRFFTAPLRPELRRAA